MSQDIDKEKSYSTFEWLLYIIILPIIFISIMTLVVLWFLDYDVKEKILLTLNKIPVIEKLIDDEQFADKDNINKNPTKDDLQYQIEELANKLGEKDSALEKYERNFSNKDEEINMLNEQVAALKEQLADKNLSEQTREQEIAELAKVYANMNPKNAANIISCLSTEEAALILKRMNIDSKSSILEKMEAEEAAKISILLKDLEYSKDQDIRALQERIKNLNEENDRLLEEIKYYKTR